MTNLHDELAWRGLVSDITEGLTDLIALRREVRVAALVFAAANYATANKVQLAGNDQWSVVHADSNPIPDITAGLDACFTATPAFDSDRFCGVETLMGSQGRGGAGPAEGAAGAAGADG